MCVCVCVGTEVGYEEIAMIKYLRAETKCAATCVYLQSVHYVKTL